MRCLSPLKAILSGGFDPPAHAWYSERNIVLVSKVADKLHSYIVKTIIVPSPGLLTSLLVGSTHAFVHVIVFLSGNKPVLNHDVDRVNVYSIESCVLQMRSPWLYIA